MNPADGRLIKIVYLYKYDRYKNTINDKNHAQLLYGFTIFAEARLVKG